jgi:hypothetical protein
MASRPKRPRDPNQLGWQIVREATGQAPKQKPDFTPASQPAVAAALGGQARARALKPAARISIAKKAAKARWGRKK